MAGEARVVRPDRSQTRWDFIDLEGLLPSDHRARVVWGYVVILDLSGLYDAIKSREGESGRPAADPAVVLALWLYATVGGGGSARELARLAERDVAYRWLAGGGSVNHHRLSDFPVEQVELLDKLLTESVTALIVEVLVSLSEIAVDGTKVRANASKKSFKSAEQLWRGEEGAQAPGAALKAGGGSEPAASSRAPQTRPRTPALP